MSKPRKRLTLSEYAAMLEAQAGVCCVKGCGNSQPFEQEHSTPHNFKPGAKPDQLMCVSCHRDKTRCDKKKIAKVKRIIRQRETGRSRPRRGRKIASRPFQNRSSFPKRHSEE